MTRLATREVIAEHGSLDNYTRLMLRQEVSNVPVKLELPGGGNQP